MERLVDQFPYDPIANYNLALGLALSGRYERALEVLVQARNLDHNGSLAADITPARQKVWEWQEGAALVGPE